MGSITLNRVTKHFRRPDGSMLEVLSEIDFEVSDGSFHSVLGPSGCGKSTILSLIAGLERPTSGTVQLDGRRVGGRGDPTNIGFVFQEPRLLDWRTVTSNVTLPLERVASRSEQNDRASRYLRLVGLEAYADYYPAQLSGGMQQRVAIARALAIEPEVLLLDEPFSGLDEMTARKMRAELLRIWEETRKTIVFVTHSISEAVYLSEEVLMVSPKPARVWKATPVALPYPRVYGDVAMFEIEKRLTREFLEMVPEARSGFEPEV